MLVANYPNSFNVSAANRSWRAAASMVDVETVFPIRKNLQFYLDVSNILEEADRMNLRGEALRPLAHY